MAHKIVEDLAKDDLFLMAGGLYKIEEVKDLDGNMTRVYFLHTNHSFPERYSLDMRYDALFITY